MLKNIGLLLLTILLISIWGLTSCDSGCPEGEREFNGDCIPISSDGDRVNPDGDDIPVVIPDGDSKVEQDQSGDEEPDKEVDGRGNCSSPFVVSLRPGETYQKDETVLSGFANTVTGLKCVASTSDGDAEGEEVTTGNYGDGVEVVVRIELVAGKKLTIFFTASTGDGLIYILQSQCSVNATCVSPIMDQFGVSHSETMTFVPESSGSYYIIMDTKEAHLNSNYSFYLSLEADSDGDLDQEESSDNDLEQDGDLDDDAEVGDTDLSDVSEEASEEDSVKICSGFASYLKTIPDSMEIIGSFTDLHWEGRSLYLVNDLGLAIWTYDSVDENNIPKMSSDAVFEAIADTIRGISYNDAEDFLYYLDNDNSRIIEKREKDVNLLLTGDFSKNAAGLTRHNDILYAVDSTDKLFSIIKTTNSVQVKNVSIPEVGSLVGLTSTGKRLFLLEIAGSTSKIHEYDLQSSSIVNTYIFTGFPLSGISYNSDVKQMWGTHATSRQAWVLTFDTSCPGWDY